MVLVAEWGVNCDHCAEALDALERFAVERADRPLVFIAVHRQGYEPQAVHAFLGKHPLSCPVYEDAGYSSSPDNPGLPWYYVVDHRGEVAYAGKNDDDAKETVDRLLMAMPAPGQLASGVVWKHFKKVQTRFTLGTLAEGPARQVIEHGLRISNPSVVSEAKAILAALDADRDELGAQLDERIAARDDAVLKDLRRYLATWPSMSGKYIETIKELERKNGIRQR